MANDEPSGQQPYSDDEIGHDDIDFSERAELDLFDPETASHDLLEYALQLGASDIFLTDEPHSVAVRLRRMGRVELVQRLSREAGRRLQNHFRAVSGADVTDQLKPTEGRKAVQLQSGRFVDVRISALPSVFGQDLALRIFGGDEAIMQIDQLGMLKSELAAVRDLLAATSGLILVAGPTGSGKTNSLYAFLKYLRRSDRKIHTIEEPIEHLTTGVVQSQVNLRGGVDFSHLLYAILRHAPDVIMIGEIRDERTAEIAIRASGSGHLVLATVHARTAVGAIQSMLAYRVNPHFLADSLNGVIAQRLVRRLCPACRFEVNLSDIDDYMADIRDRLPDQWRPSMWMPVGCDRCLDGYDQLTCVPEIMRVEADVRQAILSNRDGQAIRDTAMRNGLLSFHRAARLRLAAGITTAEELIRHLPPDEEADRHDAAARAHAATTA